MYKKGTKLLLAYKEFIKSSLLRVQEVNYITRTKCGILAEWLRRKIRNLLGSARAGSNPADVVLFFRK